MVKRERQQEEGRKYPHFYLYRCFFIIDKKRDSHEVV
jgi:hypothetical protein